MSSMFGKAMFVTSIIFIPMTAINAVLVEVQKSGGIQPIEAKVLTTIGIALAIFIAFLYFLKANVKKN